MKIYNKKNIDAERKQIYTRTSILNIIFIPGFILDFFLIKTLHFSLFIPLFYFCYSILFLQFFIKMFNADSIADRSQEDINELNNYLNHAGISAREKEIVTLIMKGYSNQKISNQLFISLSTVKTHVRNIFQKLNVESRFEIISRIKKSQ
jgi:DNA-binding CsgD family transcriptional regulator